MQDNSLQQLIDKDNLVMSVVPMPKDTNPGGSVFGGWTLAQFDIAGATIPRRETRKENMGLVTKAVNSTEFIAPIHVGDRVNFYAILKHKGNTSFVIQMVAEAERFSGDGNEIVASAEFVYVKTKPLERQDFNPYAQL